MMDTHSAQLLHDHNLADRIRANVFVERTQGETPTIRALIQFVLESRPRRVEVVVPVGFCFLLRCQWPQHGRPPERLAEHLRKWYLRIW